MSKRMKVLTLVLAVILLVTAGTATIAMAQEDKPAPMLQDGVNSPILAEVAEILDVPQDELVGILQQIWQKLREENVYEATGNLTEGKVDRIKGQRAGAQHMWQERMGQSSQSNGIENQQNTRLRISQSARGRQMIAVPRGWKGVPPTQRVD